MGLALDVFILLHYILYCIRIEGIALGMPDVHLLLESLKMLLQVPRFLLHIYFGLLLNLLLLLKILRLTLLLLLGMLRLLVLLLKLLLLEVLDLLLVVLVIVSILIVS